MILLYFLYRRRSNAMPKKPNRVSEPAVARKNMDMDVRKLTEARRILGARNDTEAVDRALDAVVYQDEVFAALDKLAEAGGVTDVYARRAKSRS
jgi:glutamate dehydrogenase/leucine dehydrogenase